MTFEGKGSPSSETKNDLQHMEECSKDPRIDPPNEKRLVKKLDLRIMPIICCIYLCSCAWIYRLSLEPSLTSLEIQICAQQVISILIDVPGPAVDSGSRKCTHTA